MTDSARPFARTHEAAREVRTAMSGYGAARRDGLSMPPMVAEEPRAEAALDVERPQLGRLAFHPEDRPYRQPARRSRWPWLLTIIVVAVSAELLWLAYEEVIRLQPTIPAARQELSPSVINPPPELLPKPSENLTTAAAKPPKPRFKPR